MTKWLQIGKHMTLTTPIDGTRGKFDWTKPVLGLFAGFMIVLIALPLSWLAVYAFTDIKPLTGEGEP